ncbi:MAG: beta-ketoacyl-ACP synthase II [Gemmatimonadales bacterium]|nr:beta-ketoacyl-ACP synthase II [Gemmatimonadales bacterium]
MPERVAITGIGCVTPIGIGVDGLRAGLRAGRSAVDRITAFDPAPFRTQVAAEVRGFDPLAFFDAKQARRFDRFGQFTLASARLALADASLDPATIPPDRGGATMGTALGGVARAEHQHETYLREGIKGVDPSLALSVFAGAASCNLAIAHGLTGPNSTNGMSCASGAMAIGEAFRAIRQGDADVMLAGGAEAPLAPLSFGAFALIRAMSTRNDDPASASRPFDRDRDGFVMAEGAAVLVLEAWPRAVARGARIYAELTGYGTTNDAHHMTAPRPDGAQAARAMRLAMAEAGLAPADVGYVNAHGSSTGLNDPTESLAIRLALGARADTVPVSGTKGFHGHALGASGAWEAAICALALHDGWLPPTHNLADPDPACDLRFVRGGGLHAEVRDALSNSFGFGGINAVLAFRRAP